MTPPGALFAGPSGAHGLPWLQALPVPAAGAAGIVILPLITYGLAGVLVREASRTDSCLGCRAGTPYLRAVAAHQPLDIRQALVARRMRCTGLCHPSAHPPEALTGQGSA